MDGSGLPLLFFFWLGILAFLTILARLTVDQLIRLEYESWRDNWEKDGRPLGYFWTPPNMSTFDRFVNLWLNSGVRLGLRRLLLTWLFKRPDWIRSDPKAYKLLIRLLVVELIETLLVVPIGFVMCQAMILML